LQILGFFLGGALFGDFPELLSPLGLILKGLAILVQSQGIISFLGQWDKGSKGSNGSNGNWTMSVLEHHVLKFKEISGTVLGLGAIFCWVLVFVILTFFEEGIGNNLTMPFWVLGLVLGSWVLEMGLGIRDLGTDTGHRGNW
jgi:hypothetical protein